MGEGAGSCEGEVELVKQFHAFHSHPQATGELFSS